MKNIEGKAIVIGKRWFDRTYGNTYHSVTIHVNGETLYKGCTYGYDNHYKQTARELLKENDYNVPDSYGDFIRLENVDFDVIDVTRKKDL